ncbi:MAG: S41 family peptidase [Porphyromonadaceae bacterium]|nr:S41 family peptidase [Porphyromonadaceae bacterium]
MKKIVLSFILVLVFGITVNAQPKEEKYFKITKNLSVFNSILRELNAYYVDTLDYDKVVGTGINSMLSMLDPYTIYMPEEMNDDIKMMTTGEYAGIGSLIMQKDGKVVISEPYEGMPAQKNDLRAGDIILEVDGVSTVGKSTSQVSEMLKGKNGTMITIKIERLEQKKPIIKKFLRENIQFNPITYSTVPENGTGYLMLNDFTDKAADEFKTVVNEMVKKDKISSLIIDVRNNPGGLVDEAVKIMGYFVPKGTPIVSTRGRSNETDRTYRTPSDPIFPDMKVAVMVNRSSASASEILAGAMQDLDRGIVIGERTFGKGLVQSIRPVGYGGHLKVTMAKYYIPSGRSVQALDYSHRNEDGSVGRIPDSLTTEFKTKNGRIVRDGGGILPDSVTTDSRKMNIAYYILIQNHYFDYANRYALKKKKIATPDQFKLTDAEYNDFVKYLLEEKNFTYTTQTENYFKQLLEVASYEGLDESAKAEFDALKAKLTPDIEQNLRDYRKEIEELLTVEIIQRYYYQKGQVQYMLKDDSDIKTAINLLNNGKYTALLGK